jgi:hypothetical protein
MKNYLIRTTLFLLFLIAQYGSVLACSCVGKNNIKKSYKSSSAVFTATVLNIDTVTITDTVFRNYFNDSLYIKSVCRTVVRVRISIQDNYKGMFSKDEEVIIETGLGKGDCGYIFSIGSRYLIYGSHQERYLNKKLVKDTILFTNICTRTDLLTEVTDKELNVLNKLKKRNNKQ